MSHDVLTWLVPEIVNDVGRERCKGEIRMISQRCLFCRDLRPAD